LPQIEKIRPLKSHVSEKWMREEIMQDQYEASVIHRAGRDYWQTWFLEECESASLFGINEKHLPLIRVSGTGFSAYGIGTQIYLEDAPYFKATGKTHRICGPYNIIEAQITPGATPVYTVDDKVLIYKEPYPERGPWLDQSCMTRIIDNLKVSFPQTASDYGYYPYRFAIKRSKKFRIELVTHKEVECWLCGHSRVKSHGRSSEQA